MVGRLRAGHGGNSASQMVNSIRQFLDVVVVQLCSRNELEDRFVGGLRSRTVPVTPRDIIACAGGQAREGQAGREFTPQERNANLPQVVRFVWHWPSLRERRT